MTWQPKPPLADILGIPVTVDPDVPAGTAILDTGPDEPRRINRRTVPLHRRNLTRKETSMPSTAGPAVDLIEHAAGIIVAAMKDPRSAPYHWAGALWEAGMLHGPGSAARQPDDHRLNATKAVLADRERELLDLKGPCSTTRCRLHYAHSGPCDIKPVERNP